VLEVFRGKKAENNKLILISLVIGGKTTKQIAEYICRTRKRATKPERLDEDELEKTMSIISRRGAQKGRLHELETKSYIKRKDGLWHLTKKGFTIALTLFNSVSELIRDDAFTWDDTIESNLRNIVRRIVTRAHPDEGRIVNRKWLRKVLSRGVIQNCLHLLPVLRDCANELIYQEVDLDNMGEKKYSKKLVDKLFEYYINLLF